MADDPADTDALISAHLDGSLDPADAPKLFARLKEDEQSRRTLLAASVQGSILVREALAAPSPVRGPRLAPRRERRRAPGPVVWLAIAAGVAAAAIPAWFALQPEPERILAVDGVVTAMRDGERIDLAGDPWLRAGDRIVAGAAPVRLTWAGEATSVILDAGSQLDVVSTSGVKRLALTRGRLDAEVATQPGSAGFRVDTARGEVAVLGTSFAVAADERATTVTVDRGVVQVTPAGGGAPTRVEAGSAAVCDEAGVRVASTIAGVGTASGPFRVDAATFANHSSRLGSVSGDAIVAIDDPSAEGVTKIQFGDGVRPFGTYSDDLEVRLSVNVSERTTVAVLMVCYDASTPGNWLGNVQADREVDAGTQELVLRRSDFKLMTGKLPTAGAPPVVSMVAVMRFGPRAKMTMRSFEMRTVPTTP